MLLLLLLLSSSLLLVVVVFASSVHVAASVIVYSIFIGVANFYRPLQRSTLCVLALHIISRLNTSNDKRYIM